MNTEKPIHLWTSPKTGNAWRLHAWLHLFPDGVLDPFRCVGVALSERESKQENWRAEQRFKVELNEDGFTFILGDSRISMSLYRFEMHLGGTGNQRHLQFDLRV